MPEPTATLEQKGDAVMKEIGALKAASDSIRDETTDDCSATAEEAVGLITLIGRAILGIFRSN